MECIVVLIHCVVLVQSHCSLNIVGKKEERSPNNYPQLSHCSLNIVGNKPFIWPLQFKSRCKKHLLLWWSLMPRGSIPWQINVLLLFRAVVGSAAAACPVRAGGTLSTGGHCRQHSPIIVRYIADSPQDLLRAYVLPLALVFPNVSVKFWGAFHMEGQRSLPC
jgi:hypothetical protein